MIMATPLKIHRVFVLNSPGRVFTAKLHPKEGNTKASRGRPMP